MSTFTQRVRDFWQWFTENEEKLSDLIANPNRMGGSEDTVAFINHGIALLHEDLQFNMGGDHEFTFAVSGADERFFLLPYVTANLPEQFREKWTFFSCMQSVGGKEFGFQMHGTRAGNDDVMVLPVPDEEDKRADLRFFAAPWAELEDNNCYGAFYTLMEITIGEALAHSCVGEVTRADAAEEGMIPLTQLEQWMLDHLCKEGKVPDPAQNYFVYQLEPEDGPLPRKDIFIGSGHFAPIINGYYSGKDGSYDTFSAFGAKPVFLYYTYENRDTMLEERNALMDKIEAEVLGERGSGQEIGLVFGGAAGQRYAYIDLLLYDEAAFFEKIQALLQEFPRVMLCKEFRAEGEVRRLTNGAGDGTQEDTQEQQAPQKNQNRKLKFWRN